MERSELEPDAEQRSALSRVTVDRMPTAHADARRTAVEIFSSADITIRDAKVLMVNQPAAGEETIIGGHWEQGIEIIYVQEGAIAALRLADVDTGDEARHENLAKGTRIILPSYVAHQFRFREAATLIVCNEVPYTPAKLVVYPLWAAQEAKP